jgi:hypothetical protein
MHVFLPVSTINITLRPHPSIPKLKHGHVGTNHLRPRIPKHRTRVLPPSSPSPWRYPHSQQTSTFPQRQKAPITDQTAACAKLSASRTFARRSKRGSDDGKSRRQRRRARDDDVLETSNSYGSDGVGGCPQRKDCFADMQGGQCRRRPSLDKFSSDSDVAG